MLFRSDGRAERSQFEDGQVDLSNELYERLAMSGEIAATSVNQDLLKTKEVFEDRRIDLVVGLGEVAKRRAESVLRVEA